MTTSTEIKELAWKFGADLCGIALVERFENAPKGFHPFDIYAGAKSVIAFAIREPESTFHSKSSVPYTFASDIVLKKIYDFTLRMVMALEKKALIAVPVPSEPYEYWDEETTTGRGILSLKHVGQLAGLGVIGRNTLLLNRKYGNLIRLGAIITNAQLQGDPLQNFVFCNDSCNRCIKVCLVEAIGDYSVSQQKCRPVSITSAARGESLYACNNCRKVCPYRAGMDDEPEPPFQLSKVIRVKNLMG